LQRRKKRKRKMDTVNHLNEQQLREELSRSQNTLAELQTNHATLQAEMDNINTGLCSFMTVLYGSPLPIASDALKDAVREQVEVLLSSDDVKVDLSSCSIAANVEIDAYLSDTQIEGNAGLILTDKHGSRIK
jgi:hypothetical protein|tara:strand:- start:2571 stop:2966 length:396 start_codon:yes stop_codon:yes gene_type:complete